MSSAPLEPESQDGRSIEPDSQDAGAAFNIRAGVYGLIAVSALLAAESASRESYGETVAAVILAIVLYWFADSYGELVALRVREGEPLTPSALRRMLLQEVSILAGGLPPLLAVLIAWAAGAGLNTAIVVALWTAAATILLTEVLAGVQADLSGRELAIQTLIGTALGLLVLGLRLVLH